MALTGAGVDLSIQQFIGAWRVMCYGGPGHAATAADGVQYVFSGVPIPFFNVAVLTEPVLSAEALRSRARQACEWASSMGVPWLFVVTHEALEPGVDAAAALDECGLATLMPMTGMIAERITPGARVPAGCAAVLDVISMAYGMDLDAGKALLGKRSFWKDHFPVVGLTGGKPACSATVLMVDGYRYVALVATDPHAAFQPLHA